MKIASIVLLVLLIASLAEFALTANALKSTKAQLSHVQAQLDDDEKGIYKVYTLGGSQENFTPYFSGSQKHKQLR